MFGYGYLFTMCSQVLHAERAILNVQMPPAYQIIIFVMASRTVQKERMRTAKVS